MLCGFECWDGMSWTGWMEFMFGVDVGNCFAGNVFRNCLLLFLFFFFFLAEGLGGGLDSAPDTVFQCLIYP